MSRRVALLLYTLCLLVVASTLSPAAVRGETAFVSAAGNRLRGPDGNFLFVLGANYVGGPDRPWRMWEDGLFDPAAVDRDLARAQAAGANAVRVFIREPLPQEIAAGRWDKLDSLVSLAEKHGLYLIVTFYDYREPDLGKVAALDRAIARRYAARQSILAWDLKNEPGFADLATAAYPEAPPPLQTDALVKAYGEFVTPAQVAAWPRGDWGGDVIPPRFDDRQAYIYANNLRIYQYFLGEAAIWIALRGFQVTMVDYLQSPDAGRWWHLTDALDKTLAAWLAPQLAAVRQSDPHHLLTVGYSDPALAQLSANSLLDFASTHRYQDLGLTPIELSNHLISDQYGTFLEKPLLLEEFGYSNLEADPAAGSVHETALLLHILSQGMAGGTKWALYDLNDGGDRPPGEDHFGLYGVDGSAKLAVTAMRALSDYASASALAPGTLRLESRHGTGLRYVYTAPDALFVSGGAYADERLIYEAEDRAQLFVAWPRPGRLDVTATVAADVHLNPRALTGRADAGGFALRREDGAAVPFSQVGDVLSFRADAGESYRLAYSALALQARIEIVYPHDDKPVSQATLANIGAYLFADQSDASICAALAPTVRLWGSLGNGVEEELAVGRQRGASAGGLSFPAWDFNDVDVAAARDSRNKYYFRVTVDGYESRSSVWSHGEDARTYLPQQELPVGVADDVPAVVDAKIEIVWPHDGKPVAEATQVNIGAFLFGHGTQAPVPPQWSPTVRLWRALNNGFAEEVALAQKVIKREGDLVYPAWEVNDVDVGAARNPLNKYYFWVTVDGVDSRSNVWSHGADARTYFPRQDVPTGVVSCD
ncbi:MAG: hypothetical protein M1401_10775 [Chloroflexi bacterium]|nr:hypothetical protein [Chloroflexota bacterium]